MVEVDGKAEVEKNFYKSTFEYILGMICDEVNGTAEAKRWSPNVAKTG